MPGVRSSVRPLQKYFFTSPHVWVRIQKEGWGGVGSGLRGSNLLLPIPGGEGGGGGGEGEVEEEELADDLLGCKGRRRRKEPKRSILEAAKMIGRTKQNILVLHTVEASLNSSEICAILLWVFSFPLCCPCLKLIQFLLLLLLLFHLSYTNASDAPVRTLLLSDAAPAYEQVGVTPATTDNQRWCCLRLRRNRARGSGRS